MNNPKSKARSILADLSIDSPGLLRHLKEICVERGAYVQEKPLSGAEGRLVVQDGRGIITVNPNPSYTGRTRFSIAHELGHFELHRDQGSLWNCSSRDMSDWQCRLDYRSREAEANSFASELLMPEAFIKPEISREAPSTPLFKSLASDYGVSLSAALYRFIELTDKACAVVFSRAGVISHAWKSKLFERQQYWLSTGKLSPYTLAFQAYRGKLKSAASRMAEVDAAAWLQLPHSLSTRTIMEQSEYFKNMRMGISLLWIKDKALIRY